MANELSAYNEDLRRSVGLFAEEEGNETTLNEAFAHVVFDVLIDAGELDTPQYANYQARGMRASGFEVSDDESRLTLIYVHYDPADEIGRFGKTDLQNAIKRLRGFVDASINGLHEYLEESSDSWDMAQRIYESWKNVSTVSLVVITNSELRTDALSVDSIQDRGVRLSVWDLTRLHRLASSGQPQEPVIVDVDSFAAAPLPCLGPHGDKKSYDSYLLAIPGDFLARVYEEFGPRLLELNVRSFLQARGKVNRGIQNTLRDEPGRFFAYNNGISMTASSVDVCELPGGAGIGIRRISGLQIVNGGQTTASLHYAMTKHKLDLSNVMIQAKLSVVDPSLIDELVPRISEFANSQNRVNSADFTSNDPFHVQVEALSRTIWAPNPDGTHQLTRWFYERARGQYADAYGRERTPAKQREFKKVHPSNQKFTKTDLAKYENTWDQRPWIVSFGAEKNFRDFMIRLEARGKFEPDQAYFESLISKAIIFKRAEKLVTSLNLGGYRSQTVTYTLSRIFKGTAQMIDLDSIWRNQQLPAPLEEAISDLAPHIHSNLISSAGSRNVGEWAKKEACWKQLQTIEWEPSESLNSLLKKTGGSRFKAETGSVESVLSDSDMAAIEFISPLTENDWFELSAWAKQTGNLQSWQRSLSFSLGRNVANERAHSRKQAIHGEKILREAIRLGFAPPSGVSISV